MNAFIIHSVLAILIFLSVITWTIAVVKIKQFKRTTAEGKSFEDAFWQANSWDSGKQIANQSNAILAQLAQTGFKEFDDYKNNPQSLKNTGDVPNTGAPSKTRDSKNLARPRKRIIRTGIDWFYSAIYWFVWYGVGHYGGPSRNQR